jgi:hypothetical protein
MAYVIVIVYFNTYTTLTNKMINPFAPYMIKIFHTLYLL